MNRPRITNRANAPKALVAQGRHRIPRGHRELSSWLGAGALTVGVGAALACGSAVAHADSTPTDESTSPSSNHSGADSTADPTTHTVASTPSKSTPREPHTTTDTTPGATDTTTDSTPTEESTSPIGNGSNSTGDGSMHGAKTTLPKSTRRAPLITDSTLTDEPTSPTSNSSDSEVATTARATRDSTPGPTARVSSRANGSGPTTTGVATTFSLTQPAVAVQPTTESRASSAAAVAPAAPTAAAATPVVRVPVSPLQSLVDVVADALVVIGGMNPRTPTPNNLVQAALYSVARWLEDTVNPGGVPQSGAPTVGTPDRITATVNFSPAFTTADRAPLTYVVTSDPTQGTVSINPDGTYTYTPTTAALFAANADTTAPVTAYAYNGYHGVQSSRQLIYVPIKAAVFTQTVTIPLSYSPMWVTINPSGSLVYVTGGGDTTPSLSVIKTATNTVTATIPVGHDPAGVSVRPDGAGAYVANFHDDTVSVVDLVNNTVSGTVPVGPAPIGVVVGPANTPAAGHVYVVISKVTATQPGSVSVINTATNTVTATIPVGATPFGAAISPDGTRLYVANSNAGATPQPGSVSVINTTTNTVTATIPVGILPVAVAVNPDGSRLYVANESGSSVSVINTATNTVSATINVAFPGGIAVSPDGSVAYVTNVHDNTVSVINTATNTIIATRPVGDGPVLLAVSPDGAHLYVGNANGNTISVLSL